MKTAVSLPDSLFEEAESTARELGLARSQLYAKAIEEFLAHRKKEYVTEALNRFYDGKEAGESKIVSAGLDTLRKVSEHDEW